MERDVNKANDTPSNDGTENKASENKGTDKKGTGKKKMPKRPSPKKLFAKIYGAKLSLDPRLQNLKIGKAPNDIPASVIAYNTNRMEDAKNLMGRLQADIATYKHSIKTRTMREGNSIIHIDEFQYKIIQAKKWRAQAELNEAKERYSMFKQLVDDAFDASRMRDTEKVSRSREENYNKRMAPSMAVKWTERIKLNGSFIPMKESAVSGSQKEFREMFSEFVTKHENEKEKQIAEKPKLFTKVMELVMDKLVEEAKKEEGESTDSDK